MNKAESPDVLASPRLRTALRLTRAGLLAERLAISFWPAASLVAAITGLVSLGALSSLPLPWLQGVLALSAVVFVVLLLRGLRRFHLPSAQEASRRLDATLPGRPLAALADVQAIGQDDAASTALWQAHRARMAQQALQARPPLPNAGLTARDPFALRLVAVLFAALGLLFGTPARLAELRHTTPDSRADALPGPAWEGWIRPPVYTGRAPLYLNALDDGGLEIPQGSQVILRFYGSQDQTVLQETVSGDAPESTPQGAEFLVRRHGEITLSGPGGRSWQIGVLPDTAPLIGVSAPPERQADGRMKLPFEASDDYGVTAGQAVIALDLARVDRRYGLAAEPEDRPAITLDLPLPYSGRRADLKGVLQEDLSAHPFANLPVTIRLTATDAAGQNGRSEALSTVLPGRRFFDPLAASVAEIRRDLLWNAANAPRSAQLIRALTWKPENFYRNEDAFKRLRDTLPKLEAAALAPADRDTLAEELLAIAALLEDGDLTSALERLKRAQDRLDEAMRNGASASEVEELMRELREALDNYMEQLARESDRDPQEQTRDTEGLEMSADQLQQMLDKLESLMAEGRMAEAQELMEMLRQLMENMQVTQGEGGQGEGQGQGRMRDLADTLRQQQDLSDEAFRQLQRRFSGQPDSGSGEGSGEDGIPQGSMEERQRDLRNRLRALGQTEMPGDGGPEADEGRRALDRSREAMEGAEEALRDGELPRALDRQAEAIEALREGMRRFEEAKARERGEPGEGAQPGTEGEDGGDGRQGAGRPGDNRDPLGRQAGRSGTSGSEDGLTDGTDPYRRALDLLEELRRRSGEQSRPELERDYLKRLLDQF